MIIANFYFRGLLISERRYTFIYLRHDHINEKQYELGHGDAAVLLPGFAIIWHDLTNIRCWKLGQENKSVKMSANKPLLEKMKTQLIDTSMG